MSEKQKKKKPLWKRLLKWTGISFIFLLIILISIPYFFKDEIIDLIRSTANENLNAKLDFEDADLTFLSTFPNLTLEINKLSVDGIDEFEGVSLAQIEKTTLKLDFWEALFGDQYKVEEVILDNPILYVKVLENGKANYDIAKTDSTATEEEVTESSPFKFALEHYQINNGNITYNDLFYATYVHLDELNHEGNITIDDIIYTLSTKTESKKLTFGYDGFNYLEQSTAKIDCDLEISMPENEMTLTFKDNHAMINQLDLKFDGSMMMNDELMDFDFTFNTLNQTFKSLLSIVPGAYSSEFDQIKTDGEIELSGSFIGKYTDTDMPGFSLNTVVKNAWLQYPDLPSTLENINMNLNISREEGPDLDNMVIDLSKFNLEFLKNHIDIALLLRHPLTDPDIKSNLKSHLDLSELNQVIPMEEGEQYSGLIDADVTLEGKASAIENEKYDEFTAVGSLNVSKINYQSTGLNYPVKVDSMLFKFAPEALELANLDVNLGSSDIHLNGTLDNYLGYLLKGDTIKGTLNFNSALLNLDELMYSEASSESTNETESTPIDSALAEVFQIPGNIHFNLNTKIAEMIYDSSSLNQVSGSIILKDEVATLHNLNMKLFGGEITMNGSYTALEPKIALTKFSYDIKDLDFKSAFNYFTSIQHYASIVKYCEGKFTTKMSLETKLDEFYYPIYQSLTGLGDLKSSHVEMTSLPPVFDKISSQLKTEKNPLKNQHIENLNLSFSFEDGRLKLKETPIKLGNIQSTLEGSTGFDQTLDYQWNTEFPSALLGNAAQDIANNLLDKVNQAAGTNVSVPNNIPIKFNIGGTITDPTVSSDLKSSAQSTKDDLIDAGKDKLNEEAKKILADAQKKADQLLAEAKVQADKIRAEADAQATKIEKEADAAHEKAVAEADKQAEKAKQEGYAAAQKLIDDAKNPVAKLAAEKAAEKLRTETDEKVESTKASAISKADKSRDTAYANADKIRTEADEKATGIEDAAQSQADKIMQDANNQVDKMTE